MEELVEFEEPDDSPVVVIGEPIATVPEIKQLADEVSDLTELAFTGTDFEPFHKEQPTMSWRDGSFSGSRRWKSSYDPLVGEECIVNEIYSLEQKPGELSIVTDPHNNDDPGVLVARPSEPVAGHWLVVAWGDMSKNYLADLTEGMIYRRINEAEMVKLAKSELTEANEDIIRALSLLIDDEI